MFETCAAFALHATIDNMLYNQTGFLGGLSARFDSLRPDSNAYQFLMNGRVRKNGIDTIMSPLKDTQLPTGIYQNVTGVGSILLCFISGECWYRDVATTNGWRRVSGFTLDSVVDVIDTEMIPASTINLKRDGPVDAVKFNNSPARSTSEGIIATDGVTQPAFIFPNIGGVITARPTFTYDQWIDTDTGELREYVPIGRFPKYVDNKLFMAIKSNAGYLNRIAHSVSGRPLDFVVQITNTGNKDGNALVTAHAVGFDEITGFYKTSSNYALVVTTLTGTFAVTPDHTRTLFAEPFLRNSPLFPSGVINNYSAVDINGHSAYISPAGIHSFDATAQLLSESNSDPISRQVFGLLAESQTTGAAIDFKDYAFFSVETVFGPAVLVFDKTLRDQSVASDATPTLEIGKFISIDMYNGVGRVKQFAKVSSPTGERLFFITADNQLFEFGAADTRETCRYYIGDWNLAIGGQTQSFRCASFVFSNVFEESDIQVTEMVDQQAVSSLVHRIAPGVVPEGNIVPPPYKRVTGSPIGMIHHQTTEGRVGFSVTCWVEWNSMARLVFATMLTDVQVSTPAQQAVGFKTETLEHFSDIVFVSNLTQTFAQELLKLPATTKIVIAGGVFTTNNPVNDYTAYATTLTPLLERGQLYGCAAASDVNYDGGLQFNTTFGRGKRYANYQFGDVEIFFYNTGWDTATVGTAAHPYEPHGYSLSSRQASVLRASLSSSTARHKVVVISYPPYSDDTGLAGISALRLAFRAWGATIVVAGGAHSYQRHNVDGMNYFVVGTGGQAASSISATPSTTYQNGRTSAGYLKLRFSRYSVLSQHIGNDGSIFDETPIYR